MTSSPPKEPFSETGAEAEVSVFLVDDFLEKASRRDV